MSEFRFSSAGESHGEAMLAVLEGVPFGLKIDLDAVNAELKTRQQGFGRSARMQIEDDQAELVAGVYHGVTSGAPLVLRIKNRDHSIDSLPPVHRPRPGHADLAGAFRYGTEDARPVLERASARETAARVAAGAVMRQFLARFDLTVAAYVTAIGSSDPVHIPEDPDEARRLRDSNDLRIPSVEVSEGAVQLIREAGRDGDTLGGSFTVLATGVPPGLGSLIQWDRRLDSRLAAAMLSIPSAKGVEIGEGFAISRERGSLAHDSILEGDDGGSCTRGTNRAGGLEGGMTNGEDLRVTVALKPLSTLTKPLPSVDLRTGKAEDPDPQRSDVCAVPAGSVVGEAMMLLVVGEAFLERFGGATLEDVSLAYDAQSGSRLRVGSRSVAEDEK